MTSQPLHRCVSSQTDVYYSLDSSYYGRCQMPNLILDSIRSNHLSYILPIFAEKNEDTQEYYPLRATLSNDQLFPDELMRRQMAFLHTTSRIDPKWYDSSSEFERRLAQVAQDWKLDPAILIANLNRVIEIVPRLTLYSFVKRFQDKAVFEISTKEWYWLLEFYMHMDIDCFFMKTSSFHSTSTSIDQQEIFAVHSPIAQFGMKKCQDRDCRFCYERHDLTYRFESAVVFSSKQMHRFVNGYWIYLNADVTCQTSNVLYALTCPCHRYDYLGRCKQPFRDRIREHRMESCRAMENFLLGPLVISELHRDRSPDPVVLFSHRKLIDHSVHCTVAWNMFLKYQPKYWCFIPMTKANADVDDETYEDQQDSIRAEPTLSNTISIVSDCERSSDLIRWCIDNLPTPPVNYRFSKRQRQKQYDFFRYRSELYPTRFLDMYNSTIVVALPDPCSDEIRHMIHALFVALTQPKLNVMATSSGDPILFDLSSPSWCANLIHPC